MEDLSPQEEDTLVCLVQDPHCLYVYWEVSPERRSSVESYCAFRKWELKPALRACREPLSPLTPGEYIYYPFLELKKGNLYLSGLAADSLYTIELGILGPEGEFLVLSQAAQVFTPPDQPAFEKRSLSFTLSFPEEETISSNFFWS